VASVGQSGVGAVEAVFELVVELAPLSVERFPESVVAPPVVPDSAGPDSFLDVPSSFAFDAARVLDPRSFFAQPVPLKWMAGAVKPFVIVPSAPHSGQNFGPWSLMPWMTSVTWPQAEQE
jgi:hypothetical protein